MKRSFVVLLLIVFGSACRHDAAGPPPAHVRFTAGIPGGGFKPLGEALGRALGTALPSVVIEVTESGGSGRNVEALQRGDADIGFSFADVAYTAFASGLGNKGERFDKLRGIAVLQLTPLHLVVGAQSGIQRVEDLKGKRVGIGLPGTGTAVSADLVMTAFNVDPESVHVEGISFNDAATRLVAGTLDAFFVLGSDPLESVAIATKSGARLIPLHGPIIESLRHEHPFLRRVVIPAGKYAGYSTPIETVGVDNVLLCRSELDESLVYNLTKALFEALPAVALEQASLRLIDLEQAPATPIPLHDGAARYYREREITQ